MLIVVKSAIDGYNRNVLIEIVFIAKTDLKPPCRKMKYRIVDYPKIQCPFVRKDIDGKYLAVDELQEGFEWIYDEGVKAVDKLHGSNLCVCFDNNRLYSIDNRTTRILEAPLDLHSRLNPLKARALEGILYALEKGWIDKNLPDGRIYGELIGPCINGNIHQVPRHMFVPFDYLINKCHWRSWIKNQYPKDFESIRLWLKDMISLFTKRIMKKELLAEGIVLYHPKGMKAKIRRDMFDYS